MTVEWVPVANSVQTTIEAPAIFSGAGLHTGKPVTMTFRPAPADHGVRFRRLDVVGESDALVPARWDVVRDAKLCTRIVNRAGVGVATIEHAMAALAGCGIHNALIDLDGPEVPILDGSALPFALGILLRGVRRLAAPVRVIRVLEPVEVRSGDASARLEPASGLEIAFDIDFADAAIGRQSKSLAMANGAFLNELCDSRTFCRLQDVETMRAAGLGLGGTHENAVVVEGDRVLSPGGFRHEDEAVRHKMLDAMGDLALAGFPILGRYTGVRAGHAITNMLLRELFARPEAYRLAFADSRTGARLPGAGITRSDFDRIACAA